MEPLSGIHLLKTLRRLLAVVSALKDSSSSIERTVNPVFGPHRNSWPTVDCLSSELFGFGILSRVSRFDVLALGL